MKHSKLTILIAIAAVLSFAVVAGCSKSKSSKSGIPAMGDTSGTGTGPTGTGGSGSGTGTGTGIGTGGGSNGTGDPPPDGIKGQLFTLINEGRVSAGVAPLVYDKGIENVAQRYVAAAAEWVRNSNNGTTFSMIGYSPNGDGRTPEERLVAGGVSFTVCGETGVFGDPKYHAPDVHTAQLAYNNLDHSVLNDKNFHRVGIGYHTEYFGA